MLHTKIRRGLFVAALFLCLFSTSAFASGTQPGYTIFYNANGGWNTPGDQYKGWNQSMTLSSQAPVRTGYDFAGWWVDLYSYRYVADFGAGSTLYMDASNSVYPSVTLPGGYDPEMRDNTVRGLVKRLYFYSYNRLPGADELNGWVRCLVSQQNSVEDLADPLFCDPNVSSKYCASCLADRLYASLLNRDPDFMGKSGWIRKAEEGDGKINGYENTVDGVIGSHEFQKIAAALGIRRDTNGILYPLFGRAIRPDQCVNYNPSTGHHYDTGYPNGTRRYGVYSTSGTVVRTADDPNFIVYKTDYLDWDADIPGADGYHRTVPAGVMNQNRGVEYFRWLVESLNPKLLLSNNIQPAWLDAEHFDGGTNCWYMVKGNIYVNRWLGVDDNAHVVADPPRRYLRTVTLWPGGTYPADSNSSATLYAQWNEKTYTIRYNANGGSGAPGAQTKYYTRALTLSGATPTRANYTFIGWNTAANGTGTNYNPGAAFNTNANTTLYAQWRRNTFTISFDANGGSNAPATATKYAGQALTLPGQKPTKEGYHFIGWCADRGGSGNLYQAGGSYTRDDDTTLYAQWVLDNTTVARLTNAKTGTVSTDETPCLFARLQKGVLELALTGKVAAINITFPPALTDAAEGWEQLTSRNLTVGSGLTGEERQRLQAEFYIPVNFDLACWGDASLPVKIAITYADGETKEITRNIRIPKDGGYLFKTTILP